MQSRIDAFYNMAKEILPVTGEKVINIKMIAERRDARRAAAAAAQQYG